MTTTDSVQEATHGAEYKRLREINAEMRAALADARSLIEDASLEWPNAEGITEHAPIAGIERSEWAITLERVRTALQNAGAR